MWHTFVTLRGNGFHTMKPCSPPFLCRCCSNIGTSWHLRLSARIVCFVMTYNTGIMVHISYNTSQHSTVQASHHEPLAVPTTIIASSDQAAIDCGKYSPLAFHRPQSGKTTEQCFTSGNTKYPDLGMLEQYLSEHR